jgi:hypothetical protein
MSAASAALDAGQALLPIIHTQYFKNQRSHLAVVYVQVHVPGRAADERQLAALHKDQHCCLTYIALQQLSSYIVPAQCDDCVTY